MALKYASTLIFHYRPYRRSISQKTMAPLWTRLRLDPRPWTFTVQEPAIDVASFSTRHVLDPRVKKRSYLPRWAWFFIVNLLVSPLGKRRRNSSPSITAGEGQYAYFFQLSPRLKPADSSLLSLSSLSSIIHPIPLSTIDHYYFAYRYLLPIFVLSDTRDEGKYIHSDCFSTRNDREVEKTM